MNSGVYKLSIGSEFYIGSSTNLYKREYQHRQTMLKGWHDTPNIQNAYNLLADKSLVVFSVLELVEKNNLKNREQFFIDLLKPTLNSCPFAYSSLKRKHSDDAKIKMSKSRLGNKNCVGRILSDETKEKIRKKAKERGIANELIQAAKRANTGRKHSLEERQKMAQSQSKVTLQMAEDIFSSRLTGEFQTSIAKRLGISQRLVVRVEQGVGIYGTDYYAAAKKRIQNHVQQLPLFGPTPIINFHD